MAAGSELSAESAAVADIVDPVEGLKVTHATARHGLGVWTLRARMAGDVVHRFSGLVGPELKQHTLQVAPGQHIADTKFIGYLSHSCDPNCRLDMSRFVVIALRDVRQDGLLTIDYAATEDVLYRQFACHCGAPGCRRWITGRAEAANAEGRAWLEGQ